MSNGKHGNMFHMVLEAKLSSKAFYHVSHGVGRKIEHVFDIFVFLIGLMQLRE